MVKMNEGGWAVNCLEGNVLPAIKHRDTKLPNIQVGDRLLLHISKKTQKFTYNQASNQGMHTSINPSGQQEHQVPAGFSSVKCLSLNAQIKSPRKQGHFQLMFLNLPSHHWPSTVSWVCIQGLFREILVLGFLRGMPIGIEEKCLPFHSKLSDSKSLYEGANRPLEERRRW